MVVNTEVKASKDVVPIDGDTTEVTHSVDNLITELDMMTDTLISQDKLLKCAARERKEFKDKLEIALKEFE
jgi:GH35 family endo-1,4-beta-xylanase